MLQSAQNLERLINVAMSEIADRCRRKDHRPLSEDAEQHRATLLQLFLPSPSSAHRRSVVLAACAVFNGDWRKHGELEHFCTAGCCASHEHTVYRMQVAMKALVKCLRAGKLCKGNCLNGADLLPLLLIGKHALLPSNPFQSCLCGARDTARL